MDATKKALLVLTVPVVLGVLAGCSATSGGGRENGNLYTSGSGR